MQLIWIRQVARQLLKISDAEVLMKAKHPINFKASTAGRSCSKLTTSLVNGLLKFHTRILQIHCYFY